MEGTADLLIGTPKDIHVVDWKFGKGVPVYPDMNAQLMTYAVGAILALEYEGFTIEDKAEVTLHIVQPGLDSFASWVTSKHDLMDWLYFVLEPALDEALGDDPQFHPSKEACRFCPASMTCRSRRKDVQKKADEIFEVYEKLPDKVTVKELAEFLEKAPVIEAYIKELRLHVHGLIDRGKNVPGWKLVAGRKTRKWEDEKKALDWLLRYSTKIHVDNIYEKKFISPAKAEKLDRTLKKEKGFTTLIVEKTGNPILVVEDDKRPPLKPNLEADKAFKNYGKEVKDKGQ